MPMKAALTLTWVATLEIVEEVAMWILKLISTLFGYKDTEAVDLGLVDYSGQGRDKYGR